MKSIFLLLISLTFIVEINSQKLQSNESKIIRHKRYLDFIPKSRMFFRSNVKSNALSTNQILAFTYGYRANYPIENDRKIRRRDVYDSIEEMMNHHGYDGRACILSTFCDASKTVTPQSGMFFKLFRKIFSLPDSYQTEYPYLNATNCEELAEHCPIKLYSLSPYTDL